MHKNQNAENNDKRDNIINSVNQPIHFFLPNLKQHQTELKPQSDQRRRENQAVHPVKHAAVSGNQIAGIFNADTALDIRFDQIADLRDYGDNAAENGIKQRIGMQAEQMGKHNARRNRKDDAAD